MDKDKLNILIAIVTLLVGCFLTLLISGVYSFMELSITFLSFLLIILGYAFAHPNKKFTTFINKVRKYYLLLSIIIPLFLLFGVQLTNKIPTYYEDNVDAIVNGNKDVFDTNLDGFTSNENCKNILVKSDRSKIIKYYSNGNGPKITLINSLLVTSQIASNIKLMISYILLVLVVMLFIGYGAISINIYFTKLLE